MMGGPYCNCPEWGGQTLHNEGCSLGRSASTRTLTITSCNHNSEIARYREALERIAEGSTDTQSRKAARIALGQPWARDYLADASLAALDRALEETP